MLALLDTPGKDRNVLGQPDAQIFGIGPNFALTFG
jgi:hypothetical protein